MLLGIACGVPALSNSTELILEDCVPELKTWKKIHCVRITGFPQYVYPSYLKYYFREIIGPELLGGPLSNNDVEVNDFLYDKKFAEKPLVTLKFKSGEDAEEFRKRLKTILKRDLKKCEVVDDKRLKQRRSKDNNIPTSIVVSNLPPRTTAHILHHFIYGQVSGLSGIDDPEMFHENGKIYGRLIFKSRRLAELCMNKLNGQPFEGRKSWTMHISIEEKSSVFVDMLRRGLNLNHIIRAFAPAGRVSSLELFKNEWGIPMDSGRVTFINKTSANNCIQMFNNTVCSIGKYKKALIVYKYEVLQHECVVCYELYDEKDMLCCELQNEESETHSICNVCARQHAESLITDGHVGQGGAGLPCSTEGCDQVILWAKVKRLVDKKTVNLLEKRLTNVALQNVKGIEFCKSCEYGEIMECISLQYFQCRNDKCYASFCRKCKVDRVTHEGLSCTNADPKNIKEKARKKYEEDLSSVTVRICPYCKTQFQKISGCNKIVCNTCKTTMCYICRATNITYDHFKITCGLYTSAQTVDNQRIEQINNRAIQNGLAEEVAKQNDAANLRNGCSIS